MSIFVTGRKSNNQTIKQLDCLVVGSDQVWHGGDWGDPRPYLLEGAPEVKAISYAASYGFEKLTGDMIELYKRGLARFSAISCREWEGVGICRSLGFSATHVVDPTLLVGLGEDEEAHKFAAKNVGALFARGQLGVCHDDKKAVVGQRWITRFIRVFSPFWFAGDGYLATLTLKDVDPDKRIYAVEAVEINQDAKSGSTPRGAMSEDLNSAPFQDLTSQLADRIAYYVGDVNRTHPNFVGHYSTAYATAIPRAKRVAGGDALSGVRKLVEIGKECPTLFANMTAGREVGRSHRVSRYYISGTLSLVPDPLKVSQKGESCTYSVSVRAE